MPRKLTQDEFLSKASKVHGNKYSYESAIYNGYCNKIKVYCNSCCCYFYQGAGDHLNGHGCPFCKARKASELYKGVKLDLSDERRKIMAEVGRRNINKFHSSMRFVESKNLKELKGGKKYDKQY